MNWWRGGVLMASLLLTAGAAMWAATPVSAGGQVVDVEGLAVPHAAVTMAASTFSPAGQVLTDASGRFHIGSRRWPYQPPSLSVEAPGFFPARSSGGRVVLHRQPRVAGRAVDDLGAPLAGAVVLLSQGGRVVGAAMTDLDGRFDLTSAAPPGEASLVVDLDQHDPLTQPVTLARDQVVHVAAGLARQLATLHLESVPSGLPARLDGEPAADCQSTPCDMSMLAGPHTVSLVSDLYVPWQQAFSLERNETASIRTELERKTGTLAVTPPAPGEVDVDGQQVAGGAWSGVLPTGPHTVGFRSATTWPASAPADVAWNQTTEVHLAPAPVTPGDAAGFAAGLRSYLAAQGAGGYGVYLEELSSASALGAGEGISLEAASVIKVPEALYLLRQVDQGLTTLEDHVDLRDEDFMGGTGRLYGSAHAGDTYSYGDLLALLIQQSDNTAWRLLDRVMGASNVDAYAASIGAGDCHQGSDLCSARSAGHMLAQLARGQLLSPASTQLLLGLLETTVFNDRINYYLNGVTVAHKVGMDSGVMNDCGVVFLSANPFAICVFTDTDNPDNGVQVIRDIARAAARYYSR